MILIHLIDGIQVEIDENAITLVYGPYPHDVGPRTYIHTLGQAVLVTTMDAGTLLALMNVIPPLVKFTRPDLTPVWVKRSAVNAVRPPLPTERQSGGEAGAVLIIGDVRQTVHEDVSSASAKLTSQDFSADKPEQRSWSYRRLRVNRIIFPVSETLGPPSSGRSLSSPPSLRFQNESSGITDNAEYLVWYGTNRRPRNPNKPSEGFSALRDSVVHYGSCLVYVPRSHKIGSLGSPLWKRLVTMTDDRLLLRAINALEEKVNWEDIAAHLASIDADDRTALIFVHGYNVSFRNAALRAAQIGFDLSIKGAMAFFSWPSKGTIAGYLADEETIQASEGAIEDFMVGFAEKTGAKAVHIIAHSMGNRGVLRAFESITKKARRRSGKIFGQIILAAADVDLDVFRRLCGSYMKAARRTTLYVSRRDRAVEASRWLHDYPRVGLMPPVLVLPGIDTINVTNVDMTRLGHGYVANARDVLADMHQIIKLGTPPNKRFGLKAAQNELGEPFWLIGA